MPESNVVPLVHIALKLENKRIHDMIQMWNQMNMNMGLEQLLKTKETKSILGEEHLTFGGHAPVVIPAGHRANTIDLGIILADIGAVRWIVLANQRGAAEIRKMFDENFGGIRGMTRELVS